MMGPKTFRDSTEDFVSFRLRTTTEIQKLAKMAASEEGNSRDIHSKYEIKRTSYKEKDLEALKLLLEVRFFFQMQ